MTTGAAVRIVIPARLRSSRLPRKVLRDIGGQTMLRRVYGCACRVTQADSIVIATDSTEIMAHAEEIDATAVLTADTHRSGTERLAQTVELQGYDDQDIIVNLQADEPFMPAHLIDRVIDNLRERPQAAMATLCRPLSDTTVLHDAGTVKVVRDREDYALYFSRAAIPFCLNEDARPTWYRHIGLYAYRAGFVRRYAAWPSADAERAESLEQLRVLHHGEKIHVGIADMSPGIGVDTAQDLARARQFAADLSVEKENV